MFSMSKLRDKSHVLLWILLFFFVASMAVGGLVGGANIMNLIFGSRNIQLYAGSVGGKNITHNQYLSERENQLARMRRQGQELNNRAYQNAGDFAWNSIIEREIKNEKIKSNGLEVSLDEIYDFLLNSSPPAFQTNLMDAGFFKNEEGKFDLTSYQDAVKNGTMPIELNPLLVRWEQYLRIYLADRKLSTLYNQLGSVSDEDIRRKYMKDSLNCTIDYIYLSISDVADSLIQVSENEILDRYNEDKEDLYTLQERRILEYVIFTTPKPVSSTDSLEVAVVQDSVMQLALDFAAEADYLSFSEALIQYELTNSDTIDVHETFEANSGIPFQMGVLRPAVRFAFDNNIGSISEPITTQNGIAVFHSLGKKSEGYKSIDEVKEGIRRTLARENKKEYAKTLLNVANNNNWEDLAKNDPLLQFTSAETQKIGGSFPGIGKNNVLTGTLLAMEKGDISNIIETFNAVTIVKVIDKDIIDDAQYEAAYSGIRTSMLNSERGKSYTSWMTGAREAIEKEDYRFEIY